MRSPTSTLGCFSIEKAKPSSVIKTEFESGYVQARERFTRDRAVFTINFLGLTTAEKEAFETHINSVRQSGIFTFTNADEGSTYQVRYGEIPTFTKQADNILHYSTTIRLEEV